MSSNLKLLRYSVLRLDKLLMDAGKGRMESSSYPLRHMTLRLLIPSKKWSCNLNGFPKQNF
uniref:Putative ovule protein n=1 Tax=Solanum chacoense TaxID=4108 RepID=A0A0V0GFY7_SOLCH